MARDSVVPLSKPVLGRKGIGFYLNRDKYLYLLLLLPIAYFVIFKYLPMYGVVIAFKDYNIFQGVWDSEWVGFANFQEIFATEDFYQVVRNTLLLNGLDLLIGFPIPIALALVINEVRSRRFKKTAQTILYLPHFLSWVIIGGIVFQVFAPQTGIVNNFVRGLGFEPIPFLTESGHWVATYVLVGVWQNAGWGTIIYLAAIASINPELYEAAEMDGAGRLRKMWHITLPEMKPTIVILLILSIGRIAMIGFERPFVLVNPIVMDYGDVISTYVYRVGLQSARFSIATAVGLFQSVVGVAFLLGANYIAEKNGQKGIW